MGAWRGTPVGAAFVAPGGGAVPAERSMGLFERAQDKRSNANAALSMLSALQ